jgi:hypothetical protein
MGIYSYCDGVRCGREYLLWYVGVACASTLGTRYQQRKPSTVLSPSARPAHRRSAPEEQRPGNTPMRRHPDAIDPHRAPARPSAKPIRSTCWQIAQTGPTRHQRDGLHFLRKLASGAVGLVGRILKSMAPSRSAKNPPDDARPLSHHMRRRRHPLMRWHLPLAWRPFRLLRRFADRRLWWLDRRRRRSRPCLPRGRLIFARTIGKTGGSRLTNGLKSDYIDYLLL